MAKPARPITTAKNEIGKNLSRDPEVEGAAAAAASCMGDIALGETEELTRE